MCLFAYLKSSFKAKVKKNSERSRPDKWKCRAAETQLRTTNFMKSCSFHIRFVAGPATVITLNAYFVCRILLSRLKRKRTIKISKVWISNSSIRVFLFLALSIYINENNFKIILILCVVLIRNVSMLHENNYSVQGKKIIF